MTLEYSREAYSFKSNRNIVLLFISLLIGSSPLEADLKTIPDSITQLIAERESFRQSGHLHEALGAFADALVAAKQLSASKAEALSMGLIGYTYLLQRRYQLAEKSLNQAMALSVQQPWPDLAALNANYLGIFYHGQRRPTLSEQYYQKSLKWALRAQDQALAVQAKLNLARLANAAKDPKRAWALLNEVRLSIPAIGATGEQARFWLQLGYQTLKLKTDVEIATSTRLEIAFQALGKASKLAVQQQDQRIESLAQGYLGQLYESQNRLNDALVFTDRATDIAQRIDAKELLLLWDWQRGRILNVQGKTQPALAAYQRAVDYIEVIRQDIPVDYHDGRSSFRETLEPVYLGLADLLLQQANQLDHPDETIRLLKKARKTVELIKKTELEDYFNNRCDIQTLPEVDLERIAPKSAALYPVILPNRLELLVSIGDAIFHRTVPVAATAINQHARSLAKVLRWNREGYQKSAQQLYQWLIAPIGDVLQRHGIDTLVFIPDGALRLVPMAALFDGEKFLIERYAVVRSPGLTLLDPKPIPRQDMSTLLAGLSKPGPVIRKLPAQVLNNLISSVTDTTELRAVPLNKMGLRASSLTRSQPHSQTGHIDPEIIKLLLDDPAIFKKVQESLTIPGAKKEIIALSKLLDSKFLLDETFIKQRLGDEILKAPYRVVHIASHGVFAHSSEQSYIMAYDEILTMD